MTTLSFLAHAGPGATWQALLTTIAFGLAIVFVLVLADVVKLREPGDLILPLAAVAIVSSLAPIFSATLSDLVGWAVPPAAMILLGLVLAAATPLVLEWTAPITLVVVVLGALGSWAIGDDLNRAWHPQEGTLPLADDGIVTIVTPEEEATVDAGTVEVTVRLEGATVGPSDLTEDQAPDDPEELGRLRLFLDGLEVTDPPNETCTVDAPCTELTWDLDIDPGAHTLIVEYLRYDGVPLAPAVFDRITLTTE